MGISNKACKISDTEYNLVLNYDYNTTGHTQWFYFKMIAQLQTGEYSNLPIGTKIKLNIVNLMKPYSLYKEGMKP
jgi:cytosolic carboxypeptidase protein 2/3